MRRLNRLTDEEFYEILDLYSKGYSLKGLLKRHDYTPAKFLQKTLTADKVKAMDFCLAARRHRERMSERFKKRQRTDRCIPLYYLDPRSSPHSGIKAYNYQNLLSAGEVENIDNYLFNN